ncbi:ankyrin [Fusarium beomiforme]|uniref:Ankyrin n=1 Tax=Fusarium beomiforme TaxID=44412 RepID=A0A9P5DU63_9HYPO|nr:ankyrin [Fusarium beomiforme]
MLLKTPMEELETHLCQYSFLQYAYSEWEDHTIASYPALLKELKIDIVKAPTLRDTWLLRTAREGQGQKAIVKKLLATEGVDVNSKDRHGRTPLSLAAMRGHKAVIKLLLATEGVDVNSKDRHGRTPLSRAAENGHEAVAKLLLAKTSANTEDNVGRTPLSFAAMNGHNTVAMAILSHESVDLNQKDHYGSTLLSIASPYYYYCTKDCV